MYINNNVEKRLFGFPKVKWLHLTAEVDKSVRFHIKFSQDLIYQKLLKSISFCQSYSKNKTVDVFGGYTGIMGHKTLVMHVLPQSCNFKIEGQLVN